MQGLMQALSWLAIAASLATSYGHGRWHYLAHRYQPGNARPHITMFAFLGFIGTTPVRVARSLADYRRQLARRQWWRVTAVLAVSYLPLLVLYTVYDAVQSWP
jgi:hypothetical protein